MYKIELPNRSFTKHSNKDYKLELKGMCMHHGRSELKKKKIFRNFKKSYAYANIFLFVSLNEIKMLFTHHYIEKKLTFQLC